VRRLSAVAQRRIVADETNFAVDPNPFLNAKPYNPCPCGSTRKYRDCHGFDV
jgi:uncharacterized protein YchJ